MPPFRKTTAPPTAALNFTCKLCNKGYARQTDYDSHLSSYDHTHRQRIEDMKKLTANVPRHATNKPTKRKLDDMSAPNLVKDTNMKRKTGGGFTRIQDLAKKQPAAEGQGGGKPNVAKPATSQPAAPPKFVLMKLPPIAAETNLAKRWGTDEDFGPNYYNPFKVSPCSPFCNHSTFNVAKAV